MSGFYRTLGGSILEMDVPAEGTHARERFDGQVAKGELALLDADDVEKVTEVYGADKDGKPLTGFRWVERAPADDARPAAPPRPAEGSIEDVIAAVRGGPAGEPATDGWEDRARSALDAEQAKGAKARTTLVARLASALAATEDQEEEAHA